MSRTAATFAPPVMEARRWLEGQQFPPERPLLNVSQAAPVAPPHPGMQAAMARALEDTATHLYGPVLGLPELRSALAADWSQIYGGDVSADQVAITAGCNQAFAACLAALAGEGDEVLLPTPWYFNQKMWCDMSGVGAVPLPTGPDLLPDPEAARARITPRTRAIVLVTPNNPGGVDYPAPLLSAFFDLARETGLRLILDETYRDFLGHDGAPHDLLKKPDAHGTLVQLYSFSKAYRLTGHRVGAVVADPALLAEIEKFLDTVAICAPQLGQRAALWGIENLRQWVAGERAEFRSRAGAITQHMPRLEARGWRLMGVGAYFAYLSHPFAESAATLAPRLVSEAGVLALPGTMFRPADDPAGATEFRLAFANIDADRIAELFDRLAALDWPLAGHPAPA